MFVLVSFKEYNLSTKYENLKFESFTLKRVERYSIYVRSVKTV